MDKKTLRNTIFDRKTYASWRKDGLRWYQTPKLKVRTGDGYAGFTMHRLIDNELDKFDQKPVQDRLSRIPALLNHVRTLKYFCDAYNLDTKWHIERTLKDINDWLPHHEIPIKDVL